MKIDISELSTIIKGEVADSTSPDPLIALIRDSGMTALESMVIAIDENLFKSGKIASRGDFKVDCGFPRY